MSTLIIILTIAFAAAAVRGAILDDRAERQHQEWMARNQHAGEPIRR